MAIDSKAKRISAINVACPWRALLPPADGSISQSDRQHLAGIYGGIAAGSGYLSTSGVFTVTRITARRALDVSQASMDQYADLIGTIIYDWQAGTYDGANYNITSGEETKNYDAAAVEVDTQLAVLWTAIDENRETWIEAWDYEVANGDEDYVLDCDETTQDELADFLYAFLQYYGVTWALSIGGGQYASGPDKASTWVSVADAASGFSAGAQVAQGNLAGI